MTVLLFSILIFLALIQWIVFIDVILSWGMLIGLNLRPRFIRAVTVPLYDTVRRYIPSSFGAIDFAPIIVFIAVELATKTILIIDPNVMGMLPQ